MVARRRTGPFLLVAPFVFDIETELPTMLDATEAAGAMWIPERTLRDATPLASVVSTSERLLPPVSIR